MRPDLSGTKEWMWEWVRCLYGHKKIGSYKFAEQVHFKEEIGTDGTKRD